MVKQQVIFNMLTSRGWTRDSNGFQNSKNKESEGLKCELRSRKRFWRRLKFNKNMVKREEGKEVEKQRFDNWKSESNWKMMRVGQKKEEDNDGLDEQRQSQVFLFGRTKKRWTKMANGLVERRRNVVVLKSSESTEHDPQDGAKMEENKRMTLAKQMKKNEDHETKIGNKKVFGQS